MSDDLIKRLENATGPSVDLDTAITLSLGFWWNGHLTSDNYLGRWEHVDGRTLADLNFSSSIDAAMTLVPEGWGGICAIGTNPSQFTQLWANTKSKAVNGAPGKSPAIALCIAALRARAAIAAKTDE